MTPGASSWRCMFENSTLAIAKAELNGRFVETNRAYHNLVGYSEEELRKITLSDLVQEDRRCAHEDYMTEVRKGLRQDFQIETRYRRKDGELIWVLNTVWCAADNPTSSDFVMSIAEEITGRKSADENQKKQNELLQNIFDHVPLMIAFVSADGHVKLVNRELQQMLGWSNEDLLDENLDIFALCSPDADYRVEVMEFIANGACQWSEFKTQTKDGRIIDAIWAQVKLSDGTAIGIGRDITKRKRAEEKLRRSEAYLAAGQRLSHTGSWAWNMSTGELFWSQETFRIFGFDPITTSASLEMFLQRIHPEDRPRIELGIKEAPKEGRDYAADYRIILPDGSIRHIHDVVYIAANESGQIVERYGVIMDMTERKLAEEERERSFDQLRALTARVQSAREEERTWVAREIHDELGQALTAIKIDFSSWVHELPIELRRADKTDSILNLVDQTIKTVRRISTELRPGIMDDLGLVAAVEWAAKEFEARTRIKCRLKLPEFDTAIDKEHATGIFRIFQETLTNVARHASATCVDVTLAKNAERVMLEVHDNGCGATPERLSAPLSLGIRGMRERALLLGGDLTIQSSPGEGTTIRVTIGQGFCNPGG